MAMGRKGKESKEFRKENAANRESRDKKRIQVRQVGKEQATARTSEWKKGAGDRQLQLLVLQENVWDPDRNFYRMQVKLKQDNQCWTKNVRGPAAARGEALCHFFLPLERETIVPLPT